MRNSYSSRFLASGAVVAWLTGNIIGFSLLIGYSFSSGHDQQPPVSWPQESTIPRNSGKPMLLMFVHPRCPCTRATLGELAHLIARCEGLVDASVLFVKPDGATEDWSQTDLWERAAEIPGVRAAYDENGSEAQLFNAATSGVLVLYNTQGQLVFSGGITSARGHAGDNAGKSALLDILHNETPAVAQTNTFGCPLFSCASSCPGDDPICKP